MLENLRFSEFSRDCISRASQWNMQKYTDRDAPYGASPSPTRIDHFTLEIIRYESIQKTGHETGRLGLAAPGYSQHSDERNRTSQIIHLSRLAADVM